MPGEPESSSAEGPRRLDEEAQLVKALREGREDAFVTLIERYHAPMLRLASIYVPRAVAEEVVQDTWLGVLNRIHGFEARSSLRTWIFRILMNRTKTRMQREGAAFPSRRCGIPPLNRPSLPWTPIVSLTPPILSGLITGARLR